MELFNEFVLSLITILVAILIAKLAPAAAELGRYHSNHDDHSVELEELGRRRSETSDNVEVGSGGVHKVDEISEARSDEPKSDEFDLKMDEKREFKKSDVTIEEGEEAVQESESCFKIGEVDDVAVKFEEDEKRSSESYSGIEKAEEEEAVQESESCFKIGEVDDVAIQFEGEEKRPSESYSEIGKVDDVAAKVVLEEEDKRSDVSVTELNESVSVGQEAAELVDFDQEEGESEAQLIDFCKDVDLVKEGLVNEEGIGMGEEKEGTLLYGEDEWEGIEKSELEKQFGMAVGYVGSKEGGSALSKVSSDVQKQLYGLHKVATEGPCYEAQPLALKVAARAKWHSWQKLGNMNPDVAMEQYIALLSESIPGWMKENYRVDTKLGKCNDIPDVGASKIEVPDFSSRLYDQPKRAGSRRSFEEPSFVEVDQTSSSNLSAKGLTKTAFFFDLLSPTTTTFLTLYR